MILFLLIPCQMRPFSLACYNDGVIYLKYDKKKNTYIFFRLVLFFIFRGILDCGWALVLRSGGNGLTQLPPGWGLQGAPCILYTYFLCDVKEQNTFAVTRDTKRRVVKTAAER